MYLAVQGIALRLIRVDDFERFMAQEQEYRNRLLGGFPAAVIKNVSWAEASHNPSPGRNSRRACQRRKRGYIEVEGPKALLESFLIPTLPIVHLICIFSPHFAGNITITEGKNLQIVTPSIKISPPKAKSRLSPPAFCFDFLFCTRFVNSYFTDRT